MKWKRENKSKDKDNTRSKTSVEQHEKKKIQKRWVKSRHHLAQDITAGDNDVVVV